MEIKVDAHPVQLDPDALLVHLLNLVHQDSFPRLMQQNVSLAFLEPNQMLNRVDANHVALELSVLIHHLESKIVQKVIFLLEIQDCVLKSQVGLFLLLQLLFQSIVPQEPILRMELRVNRAPQVGVVWYQVPFLSYV